VRTCDRGTTFTRTLLGVGQNGEDAHATVDVAELVRGVEPLLRQVVTDRILLMTFVGGDLPRVVGRVADLELVLLNLAVNARDAIQGEGTIVITAVTAAKGGESAEEDVVLTVRDSGSGMPIEVQERIFDHFFTTKGVQSGTGLGLALVRETVRSCGGSIDVDSKVGSGTSMSVRLRAAPEAAHARRFGRAGASHVARADIVLLHPGVEAPQDVVIDLLRRHGLGVVVVGSADEARAAIAKHGPSVILALSGTPHEVLASARPEGVGPRAILLSGGPLSDHPVALPGDRVLPAGFCPDLLLAEVEQVLTDVRQGKTASLH